MSSMFNPLRMPSGHVLRNRLMLAPLTTQQSYADGRVSHADREWLALRAKGGFGLVATAAAAITADSRAFPGQYGTYSERFLLGLRSLAGAINQHGAISLIQLQHGGGRSLRTLTEEAIAPSASLGAREANTDDLADVVEAFASSAERSIRAGFHGVQVHGAYGFLLAQFLDPEANKRTDRYGGALDNRARLLREVLSAIRARVPSALLSVRLNLRDRGLQSPEMLALAGDLLAGAAVDHVDLVIEEPSMVGGAGQTRLAGLKNLSRGAGSLGITGGFSDARSIAVALDNGADLVGIGTAGVLHPDFPKQLLADPSFRPKSLPVPADYLIERGVSSPFLRYLAGLPGFVANPDRIAA